MPFTFCFLCCKSPSCLSMPRCAGLLLSSRPNSVFPSLWEVFLDSLQGRRGKLFVNLLSIILIMDECLLKYLFPPQRSGGCACEIVVCYLQVLVSDCHTVGSQDMFTEWICECINKNFLWDNQKAALANLCFISLSKKWDNDAAYIGMWEEQLL